jgi:hypothetical protein
MMHRARHPRGHEGLAPGGRALTRAAAVVAMAVLASAAVTGCSLLPPPGGIQLTIPATADIRALPVTVVDHAGIVRRAAPSGPALDDPSTTVVRGVPGRVDQLSVHWIGGDCDDRTILTIDTTANGYTLTVEPQSSASGCDAVGIFRSVLLDTTQPVNPDDVAVR